jgi:hypothetical protein
VAGPIGELPSDYYATLKGLYECSDAICCVVWLECRPDLEFPAVLLIVEFKVFDLSKLLYNFMFRPLRLSLSICLLAPAFSSGDCSTVEALKCCT